MDWRYLAGSLPGMDLQDISSRGRILFGLPFVGGGLTCFLLGIGVISTGHPEMPRWPVMLIGVFFGVFAVAT